MRDHSVEACSDSIIRLAGVMAFCELIASKFQFIAQPVFMCSNSTIKTTEQYVKSIQN